jgi:hypothetical protein
MEDEAVLRRVPGGNAASCDFAVSSIDAAGWGFAAKEPETGASVGFAGREVRLATWTG